MFAPMGTGDSSPPATPEGWRVVGYVEDLEQLRLHLGLDTLTLYGSSHGGIVVLACACRFPERVDRLILASTLLRFDDAYQKAIAEQEARFAAAVPDGASRLADSKEASAHDDGAAMEGTLQRGTEAEGTGSDDRDIGIHLCSLYARAGTGQATAWQTTSLNPRSRSGRPRHWMSSSPRSCASSGPGRATRWKSWD